MEGSSDILINLALHHNSHFDCRESYVHVLCNHAGIRIWDSFHTKVPIEKGYPPAFGEVL